MTTPHDEIEIEDFEYDEATDIYFYPCPCGDLFQISGTDLKNGEDIAECETCSLYVKVIYDKEAWKSKADEVSKDGKKQQAKQTA